MEPVRYSLPLTFSTLVITLLTILMTGPARADNVIFHDTTDTVTATTSASDPTNPRITISQCGITTPDPVFGTGLLLEACTATVSAPSGATAISLTGPFSTVFGEGDGTVSDFIASTFNLPTTTIEFLSDTSVGIPCSGACVVTEDGTVQSFGTLTWLDKNGAVLATDNVSFQSDVEVVPEPASVALLGSGLLSIIGYTRRRRLA
jgi:hypothetical protein